VNNDAAREMTERQLFRFISGDRVEDELGDHASVVAGDQSEREHNESQALASLTPREREILQALADGLDTQKAADRLQISIRTVPNHIHNILAKLGVHSQLQALVLALRYDVVTIRKGHTSPSD
jgi:DNA-binding NarL/FixJ family response regulator